MSLKGTEHIEDTLTVPLKTHRQTVIKLDEMTFLRNRWRVAAIVLLILALLLSGILLYNTGIFCPYISARGSDLYHTKGCHYMEHTHSYNRIYYLSAHDARQQGKYPCLHCLPE